MKKVRILRSEIVLTPKGILRVEVGKVYELEDHTARSLVGRAYAVEVMDVATSRPKPRAEAEKGPSK